MTKTAQIQSLLEIKPGIGFSTLLFGSSMKEAKKIFGKADKVSLDDGLEGFHSIIWEYRDNGFSLYFDELNNQLFQSVYINRTDGVLLWGLLIFKLKEKQIIKLFKSKGFTQYRIDNWDKRALHFEDIYISFFFYENKLNSIIYGIWTPKQLLEFSG